MADYLSNFRQRLGSGVLYFKYHARGETLQISR